MKAKPRRLKHGDSTAPPDTRPARCYPSDPVAQCATCTRRRFGFEVESIHAVVIDASTALRSLACALWR